MNKNITAQILQRKFTLIKLRSAIFVFWNKMQKLSHPYWSEAFVYYKQLTSMVDFLNRNARFDGLFSGETVSSVPS